MGSQLNILELQGGFGVPTKYEVLNRDSVGVALTASSQTMQVAVATGTVARVGQRNKRTLKSQEHAPCSFRFINRICQRLIQQCFSFKKKFLKNQLKILSAMAISSLKMFGKKHIFNFLFTMHEHNVMQPRTFNYRY